MWGTHFGLFQLSRLTSASGGKNNIIYERVVDERDPAYVEVEFTFSSARKVMKYKICSANDDETRDPSR